MTPDMERSSSLNHRKIELNLSSRKPAFLLEFQNLRQAPSFVWGFVDMSSSSFSLRFGVEMEFLLKPKPALTEILEKYRFNYACTTDSRDEAAKQANRIALRKALAEILESRDIPAVTSVAGYDKWTMAEEGALDEQPGFCET